MIALNKQSRIRVFPTIDMRGLPALIPVRLKSMSIDMRRDLILTGEWPDQEYRQGIPGPIVLSLVMEGAYAYDYLQRYNDNYVVIDLYAQGLPITRMSMVAKTQEYSLAAGRTTLATTTATLHESRELTRRERTILRRLAW